LEKRDSEGSLSNHLIRSQRQDPEKNIVMDFRPSIDHRLKMKTSNRSFPGAEVPPTMASIPEPNDHLCPVGIGSSPERQVGLP
jgi:hypothetical protein